jgi:hypothetical protein
MSVGLANAFRRFRAGAIHVGLPSFVMLLEIIGVGGQTASKYTHGIAELLALCLSHAGNCLQGV